MALRLSFVAVVVPVIFVGCGDTTKSAASSGGASSGGAIAGSLGSGGVTKGSIGGAGGGVVAGASAGASPASSGGYPASGAGGSIGFGGAGTGGSEIANGGTNEAANLGGAGIGGGAGDGANAAGTAGTVGGIPPNWLMVTDVDYSVIPGPNFETVRLMFEAAQCSGSNCHYGGKNHFQMGKSADQLYTYMMSFKTLQCGKLIDTANPAQSALVRYLRGPCGEIERMPSYKCFDDGDEQCVPEYYIQAIEQWIADGAPR